MGTLHINVANVFYENYQVSQLATRYFFRSPLPLVRYLDIVLRLRAGPQLSNIR
jgi:hypothetical protein